MEKSRISLIFRFTLILGLLSLFMIFFTTFNTAEFYISCVTFAINVIVAIIAGVLIRKKHGENK